MTQKKIIWTFTTKIIISSFFTKLAIIAPEDFKVAKWDFLEWVSNTVLCVRGEKSLIVEHVLKCYDLWADRVYRGQKSREFNDMSSGKLT